MGGWVVLVLACLVAGPALAQKDEAKRPFISGPKGPPVKPLPPQPAAPAMPPPAPPVPEPAPEATVAPPAVAPAETPAPVAPPAPVAAMGIGLEGVAYPYPVHFRDVARGGVVVRMAFMDVAPADPAATRAVVLLHGRTLSSASWGSLAGVLAAGARVVIPDQLGFFKSGKPDDAVTLDEQAAETLALLDDLGVARADLVGQGMGAMLAVRIARAAPARVGKLVLSGPLGLEDYRLSMPYATTEALMEAERGVTPEAYGAAVRADAGPRFPADLLEGLVAQRAGLALSGEYPRWLRAYVNQEQVLYAGPVAHEITLVEAPTLFVIGAEDHAAPGRARAPERLRGAMGQNAALARTLADRMRAGRVVVLEGVGHFAPVEAPEVFGPTVAEFLR